MRGLCHHLIRIPTRFSVNLAVAGALVMYDRLIAQGRFAARPLLEGKEPVPLPAHVFGEPIYKRRQAKAARAVAHAAAHAGAAKKRRP
jgi:hypothetical protein